MLKVQSGLINEILRLQTNCILRTVISMTKSCPVGAGAARDFSSLAFMFYSLYLKNRFKVEITAIDGGIKELSRKTENLDWVLGNNRVLLCMGFHVFLGV